MKQAASRALHAYWDKLRAGRAAPERCEVEPGAIRSLLGDVFLLEGVPGARHQVRLAGTRICSLLGREWKGRPFVEPFAAEECADIQALVEGVSAASQPATAGVAGETRDGRRLSLELLLLPLRHRGRPHTRLMGSLVAEDWPYWAGTVPLERLRIVSVRHLLPAGRAASDLDFVSPPGPRPALGRLRILPGGRH